MCFQKQEVREILINSGANESDIDLKPKSPESSHRFLPLKEKKLARFAITVL